MFKKIVAKLKEKALGSLKGKLTYTGVAVAILVAVAKWLEVPLAEDQAVEIVQFFALLVAAFGKWRAGRNYE